MKRWTVMEREYLQRALADAHSLSAIAKCLGRSPRSVRQKTQALGVKLRTSAGPNPKLIIRLPAAHCERLRDVADELSMTPVQMARMIIIAVLRDDWLREIVTKP
jgi:hypothetical protein